MKWKGIRSVYYAICMLFLCMGCQKKEDAQVPSGMVCEVGRVRREALIQQSKHSFLEDNRTDVSLLGSQDSSYVSPQLSLAEQHQQYEAQLVDVAVPIMATSTGVSCDSNGGILLSYHCSLAMHDLKEFYRQEMERLGWRQVAFFDGQEIMLSFIKPGRFCMVMIRQGKKGWNRPKQLYFCLCVGTQ